MSDILRTEHDIDPVFCLVDVRNEGESVTCGLELIFNLIGDLSCTVQFEFGGFSAACPDLDHAFVVASGDPAASIALFKCPDKFDLCGFFEWDAVERAANMHSCKRSVVI